MSVASPIRTKKKFSSMNINLIPVKTKKHDGPSSTTPDNSDRDGPTLEELAGITSAPSTTGRYVRQQHNITTKPNKSMRRRSFERITQMLKRDDDMHDRPAPRARVSSAGNLQDMVEDSYHGPSTNNEDSVNSTESGSDSSAVSTQPPPVPVRKNTGGSGSSGGDHEKTNLRRQTTSTSCDPPEETTQHARTGPPPPPYQAAQRSQRHSASHLEDLYQYQQLTGLRRETSHGQQQLNGGGGRGGSRGRKSASHIDQMYEVMQQQEHHTMRKQHYHHGPHIGHHPPTNNNKDQQMLDLLLNNSEPDILFDDTLSPKREGHAFHHSEGALHMAYNPKRTSQRQHGHSFKSVGGENKKKGENTKKKKKKQQQHSSSSSSKQKHHHHNKPQRSKSSDMLSGLDHSNRSHESYSSNYSELQSVTDYNMDIPLFNKQKSGGSGGGKMNENWPEAQPSSAGNNRHRASSHDIYPMGGGSNKKREGERREGGTKSSGRRQRSPHPVREFTDPSASSQHDHKHQGQGQGKGHHGSSGGRNNNNMKHPHQPSKKKSHSSSHHHSHHHSESSSSSTKHNDPPIEDDGELSRTYSKTSAASNTAQQYVPTRKHKLQSKDGGTSATPRSGPTDSPQKLSLDSLKFSSSNNDKTKQNAHNTTFNSDGSAITVHTLDSFDAQKLQTAEQLRDLIELMQAEFQKLKQAKDSAEMKAQTLETDISRMEQEHDADFVKLSSDCEHWKNIAQQEQARYDSVVHKMDRLEAENDTMKLQWSKAIKSKSDADEKAAELEKKNHALKKLLKKVDRSAYKKYKKDTESSNHEKKKGEKDSSSTIPTKMDSSHGDCSSSVHSLALSVATASKVLETGAGQRYDTPPMTIETINEALHHGQTQHQHNAARSPLHNLYGQHEEVGEAPASWHPGKKTKSLRKMPEISLPLN